MRELSISDMHIVSGGYTETQCTSGLAAAGGVFGALLGAGFGAGFGAGLGIALGTAAGQIICPATNNGNTSEDGDG